jgi:uncharacterized protein YjiS (DUF1127 family)
MWEHQYETPWRKVMIGTIANKFRQHREYRRTVNELARLSDRELSDLGIGRSEIRGVARLGAGF